MNRLPNLITGARLALALFTFFALAAVPLLGAHLTDGQQYGLERWAFVAFVVAAVTDFVDGWLARKLNAVSVWGAILDPIGDKVLVCGVILGLMAIGSNVAMVVPAALILFREFTVSALREVTAGKGIKLPVTLLAKWKTTLQLFALGAELLVTCWGAFGLPNDPGFRGTATMAAHVPTLAGGGGHPDHRGAVLGAGAQGAGLKGRTMDDLAQGLQLTALDPTYRADPYPRLRQAREACPVRRDGFFGAVQLTRYADVRGVLTDRTLWRDPMRADDSSLAKTSRHVGRRPGRRPPQHPDQRRSGSRPRPRPADAGALQAVQRVAWDRGHDRRAAARRAGRPNGVRPDRELRHADPHRGHRPPAGGRRGAARGFPVVVGGDHPDLQSRPQRRTDRAYDRRLRSGLRLYRRADGPAPRRAPGRPDEATS